VADDLDVLAVGVEDEGGVVVGVVDLAGAGAAVVAAAGGNRGGVEGVDGAAIGGGEATWTPWTVGRPRTPIQK
jgi:hypothetical protein